MAYITKEEREGYYNKFPPGAKVMVRERHEWHPGEVVERYGQHGTIYIRCKLLSGLEVFILYGNRDSIALAPVENRRRKGWLRFLK